MKNKYTQTGTRVDIHLPNGLVTKVNSDRLPLLRGLDVLWYAARKGNGKDYVQAIDNGKTLYLHRILMDQLEEDKVVDHKDGNTLNNMKSNLRQITKGQNNQNRTGANRGNATGIRGLTYNKGKGKYVGRVRIKGVLHIVGYYTEDEFDLASKELEAFRKKHMPYN